MKTHKTLRVLICGLCCCMSAQGQSGAEYPRTPWGGYPYPASYDAEIADPDVHRVLFENENIMFLEVSNPPGLDVRTHGHPYPSVFARDTGGGPGTAGIPLEDTHLDPTGPFAGKGWNQGPAPSGLQFPRCTTAPPESPHKPINHGTVPVHFYRIEFRRLDGEDVRTHWKDWYPWMLEPVKPAPVLQPGLAPGPKLSDGWPYPRDYDSERAAPNNYRLLYEDGHVRLLEVAVRPGETTPAHGNPYASVLAFNAVVPDERDIVNTMLDAKATLNWQGAGHASAPSVFNLKAPTCTTVPPQAPHTIRNNGQIPLHYYRI